MNKDEELKIKTITNLDVETIKLHLKWFAEQDFSLMNKLIKNQQKLFNLKKHKNYSKSVIFFSCLIISINNFRSLDSSSINYQLVKRKTKSEKLDKLLNHRNLVLELTNKKSLREAANELSKKLRMTVSHSYINAIQKKIRNGEI